MTTVPPELSTDQVAIITDYQAFSAVVSGPALASPSTTPIPARPEPTITGVSPDRGAPGSSNVTIAGTELESTSAVFFNEKKAKHNISGSGVLTADVPDGLPPGAKVDIAVVTALGTVVGSGLFTTT